MTTLEKEIYKRELESIKGRGATSEKELNLFIEGVKVYTDNLIYLREGTKIDDLLEKEGLEVVVTDRKNSFMRANLKIDEEKRCIIIYRQSLKELAKSTKIYDLETLVEIAKVHEYFHLLEFKGLVNLDLAKINKRGFFFSKELLDSTRVEIIAHEFVKKNLRLKYSPIVLDYICSSFEDKSIFRELPDLKELVI